MARWDNEEIVGNTGNPKDCFGCVLNQDNPEIGICDAFPGMKPFKVYFEGEPCPEKETEK